MKLFKSLVAGLAAMTICASSCVIGAFANFADMESATLYDPRDVNHDGDINVTDVLAVQGYLLGYLRVDNYNQLDANRSMTVDEADVKCISAYVQNKTYNATFYSETTNTSYPFNLTSGFTPDYLASSMTPRQYLKHNFSNSASETGTSYNLTPSSTTMSTPSSLITSIIGTDETEVNYDHAEITGIVKLDYLKNNAPRSATGFIIDDHIIATAAHCVYDKEHSKWCSNMVVTAYSYDSSGNLISTPYSAVQAHIPAEYITNGNNKFDYALLTINSELSSAEHKYFNLGVSYNVNATNYANIPLRVTGFRGDNTFYSGEGWVVGNSNSQCLHYSVDTGHGQSGAPVYTVTKYKFGGSTKKIYTALAIHHGEFDSTANTSSRITKYHLQFYFDNPNISY
ncbi:trypsin-like peptidase domain-containing protein [Ruminococcus sp.]|uniref:trypsin-like peptidase domain-containing protein n=1 Tax=Ruminococcus sp. TaxID=41978 RepID=UPI0025E0323E|nr:trypsin-like peptidase domain-containing protein [Ruminococcus sp.]MBQ8964980.1 trypsin-like peptidase domain-containing protein [Ruminococcus sp.]